jgi:hypothetical protein
MCGRVHLPAAMTSLDVDGVGFRILISPDRETTCLVPYTVDQRQRQAAGWLAGYAHGTVNLTSESYEYACNELVFSLFQDRTALEIEDERDNLAYLEELRAKVESLPPSEPTGTSP